MLISIFDGTSHDIQAGDKVRVSLGAFPKCYYSVVELNSNAIMVDMGDVMLSSLDPKLILEIWRLQ